MKHRFGVYVRPHRAIIVASLLTVLCASVPLLAQGFQLPTETLNLYLQKEVGGLRGRAEVTVGQIDPRLTLAPCHVVEPYIPAGVRLWGRSSLGLRCKQGAQWNITVPVEVRVFAQAWIANRPLPAQTIISRADFSLVETEVSREPGTPVTDLDAVVGQQLVRPLPLGAVVRSDVLRAAPILSAGDSVRVVALGRGFSIQGEGEALAAATEGQSIRVKLDNGRVITGVARQNRVVELRI